jgi:hypothetical protein
MTLSFLQQVLPRERAACLLKQPSIAKITKINDRIGKSFEQGVNALLRVIIVCRNLLMQ